MLEAAKREKEGWIDSKSAEKFSCEELRMIDREWLAASGGQFGFSVQLAIYKQTGNQIGDYNGRAYDRFADAVGWRVNGNWKTDSDLTWSTNAPSSAPKGHLPGSIKNHTVVRVQTDGRMLWGWELISRAAACEL